MHGKLKYISCLWWFDGTLVVISWPSISTLPDQRNAHDAFLALSIQFHSFAYFCTEIPFCKCLGCDNILTFNYGDEFCWSACDFCIEVRPHQATPDDWLKVPERVEFKLAVLVDRCLHQTALPYLAEEFHQSSAVETRHRLRSASTSSLVVRRTRLSTIGDRAFPVDAARLWNILPLSASSISFFQERFEHPSIQPFFRRISCSACAVTLFFLDTIIHLVYYLLYGYRT